MPAVEILIELLQKIAKSDQPTRIEVDYNGREFYWKVPQHNITANQWEPNRRKHKSAVDSGNENL